MSAKNARKSSHKVEDDLKEGKNVEIFGANDDTSRVHEIEHY